MHSNKVYYCANEQSVFARINGGFLANCAAITVQYQGLQIGD
jgi:hypothetical protein